MRRASTKESEAIVAFSRNVQYTPQRRSSRISEGKGVQRWETMLKEKFDKVRIFEAKSHLSGFSLPLFRRCVFWRLVFNRSLAL